jgi:hypothetical protein
MALEGASEARSVFVTYREGDLLNAHIRVRKELACSLHSVFNEEVTQAQARSLFKQVLKVGLAQVALQSQVMNLARRTGFNHLQDSADAALLHPRSERAQINMVVPGRSLIARDGLVRTAIRGRGIAALFFRRMKCTHELPFTIQRLSPRLPETELSDFHVSRRLSRKTQCPSSQTDQHPAPFKLPT